ncbi:hypothetical protein C1141_18570 [Vibrio agarivorans]|nr:hypothetical protein C1141_18570 [Vibrio agarivorans]
MTCCLLLSFICHGESTDVYCATIDGSSWDWLYDESGDYAKIEGEWGFHLLQNQEGFGYLTVNIDDYMRVQEKCELKGMVAHPGNNRFSSWFVFQVKTSSGQLVFTQGSYSIFVPKDYHL